MSFSQTNLAYTATAVPFGATNPRSFAREKNIFNWANDAPTDVTIHSPTSRFSTC
jgi:hypothetical protein